MTIRFASAHTRDKSAIWPWRCRSVALCAANDNACYTQDDAVLVSALRHFAHHGLAAAVRAAARASQACLDGDQAACFHWLAVCRQFDRRMADRIRADLPLIAS